MREHPRDRSLPRGSRTALLQVRRTAPPISVTSRQDSLIPQCMREPVCAGDTNTSIDSGATWHDIRSRSARATPRSRWTATHGGWHRRRRHTRRPSSRFASCTRQPAEVAGCTITIGCWAIHVGMTRTAVCLGELQTDYRSSAPRTTSQPCTSITIIWWERSPASSVCCRAAEVR